MNVPVRKFTVAALRKDRTAVFRTLAAGGCCEIAACYPYRDTVPDEVRSEQPEQKAAHIDACLRFRSEQVALAARKLRRLRPDRPVLEQRREISMRVLSEFSRKLPALAEELRTLEALRVRRDALRGERESLVRVRQTLLPFLEYRGRLSGLRRTERTAFLLVSSPSPLRLEECQTETLSGGDRPLVLIACPLAREEEVRSALLSAGAAVCPTDFPGTAAEWTGELLKREKKIAEELQSLAACAAATDESLLRQGYDYYLAEAEREAFVRECRRTQECFFLSGWVPVTAVETLREQLASVSGSARIWFSLPEEGDEPPTYLRNHPIVAPFESVTNLYSVPAPGERDPNLFVMIFFLIFFGMMLSDAGYGIILAVGAFCAMRFLHPETATRRMLFVLALGGVSTVLWGTLFGGWFGIELSPDSPSAAVRFLHSLKWFSPLEEPLLMLALCVVLGILQILVGMALHLADLLRNRAYADAFCDVGVWFVFFFGLGAVGIASFPGLEQFGTAGLWIMLAALLLVVATAGRRKKGVFARILAGFGGLYALVGYLSDVLSYTRLFGLGLATGVIALVMNTLAFLLFQNPWTAIFGVAIAAGGHIFNLAVNVLGTYIHDCRLQYIEFFSRFYTGGGHSFRPMLSGLRFHKIIG